MSTADNIYHDYISISLSSLNYVLKDLNAKVCEGQRSKLEVGNRIKCLKSHRE